MEKFFEDAEEATERVVESEHVEEKTGNKSRTAIITVLGAAIGAFVGDSIAGREYLIEGHDIDTYASGNIIMSSDFTGHARDNGAFFGLLDDNSRVYKIDENWTYSFYGSDSTYSFSYTTDQQDLANYVQHLDSFNETIIPDGAMVGAGAGAVGGVGADFIRKRHEKREEDKKY